VQKTPTIAIPFYVWLDNKIIQFLVPKQTFHRTLCWQSRAHCAGISHIARHLRYATARLASSSCTLAAAHPARHATTHPASSPRSPHRRMPYRARHTTCRSRHAATCPTALLHHTSPARRTRYVRGRIDGGGDDRRRSGRQWPETREWVRRESAPCGLTSEEITRALAFYAIWPFFLVERFKI
jgi:hypothetical protein